MSMPVTETISALIRKRFEVELKSIIGDLRDELDQQGHHATGSLERSLRHEITDNDTEGFLGVIFGNDYWGALDTGVSASRIPYSPGKGRGGTSKYIQALIDWAAVVKPGLSEKERKGFVFAVATKASREGHPTRGSYSFSRNGDRKNFVQKTIDKHVNTLAQRLSSPVLADQIAVLIMRAAQISK